MAIGDDDRLGRLPEALEERLRNLDRLAGDTARGMEDLGRRASSALEQILVRGADAESVLQRLLASLSQQVLQQTVFRPLGGLLGGAAAGPLLPGADLVARSAGATLSGLGGGAAAGGGAGPISITVNAAGGDPRQLRLAVGQAAAQLARVVERGRREL